MSNYKLFLHKNNTDLYTNNLDLQSLIDKAINLPNTGGVELPELTNEGTAEDLLVGKELIDSSGNVVIGTFTIDSELTTQETLLTDQNAKIAELAEILDSKASITPILQDKTVTPTTETQTITADDDYDGLNAVTVNGDSNLIAENIKRGVSIFGVNGTLSEGNGGSVDGDNTFPYTITVTNNMDLSHSIFYTTSNTEAIVLFYTGL